MKKIIGNSSEERFCQFDVTEFDIMENGALDCKYEIKVFVKSDGEVEMWWSYLNILSNADNAYLK